MKDRDSGLGPKASKLPRTGDSSFRSRYGYFVAILLTLLLIAQLIPASRSSGARRGVIEISGHPDRQGVTRLKGEWVLYWGRLLRPADFEGPSAPAPDAYIWLPSIWTRTRLSGRPLPSVGDATFRLIVRHPWKGRELGIKIMRINCAFELYADSKLIASGGSLSDSPGGFSGAYAPQSVYFTPSSAETVLTLRVSNRIPGAWSGPIEEMVIGPRKAIESESSGSIVADAFNLSGRLFLAILFLALFLLLGSRLAAVFSATNLVMMLRAATTREMVILRLFPSIDFGIFLRLQIFSSLALLPFLLFTFEAFLRESRGPAGQARTEGRKGLALSGPRDWAVIAAAAICAAVTLYLCLAENSVFLRYFPLFIPGAILCFAYYSVLVLRDAARRRVGPAQSGLFLLFFYFTAYEILCQFRVIDQAYMYPLFFLKGIPPLAGLATLRLHQGIISYLDIAAIGFYFAYDILNRHSAVAGGKARRDEAAAATEGNPARLALAERDRLVMIDPQEIALIKERVERAIGDPAILGKPDLDVRSLAAMVRIPPYRLSGWFNNYLKISFPSWLNARRVERAQALMLDHPDRTIIDIAMESGYASKSVFNEQFRRIVGMNPSEWRRSSERDKD